MRDRRAVAVKGLRQKVTVAEVSALKPLGRLTAPARLLGRDAVLEQIRGGGSWLISAPPGLGKSAVVGAIAGNGAILISARGNLQRTPLLPFADWLGQWLGADDLGQRLEGRGLSGDEISALQDILGLSAPDWLAPAQRRANRIAALGRLLAGEMAAGSGLLVFDDLHGADAGAFPSGARGAKADDAKGHGGGLQ